MSTDKLNKGLIIGTLCLAALSLTGCEIWLSVNGLEINPSVDKLVFSIFGGIVGLLGRTSSDEGRRASDDAVTVPTGESSTVTTVSTKDGEQPVPSAGEVDNTNQVA